MIQKSNDKVREYLEKLLNKFTVANLIYDNSSYDNLKCQTDDDLLIILEILSNEVKLNKENMIYSKNIKENLYRLFSIYRERFKDESVLNKINDLINILNSSLEEKVIKFYAYQYSIRFCIYKKLTTHIDKPTLESKVCSSISNDNIFLYQLLYEKTDDFIIKNLCKELSFSNLNYLLYVYPETLDDEELRIKIINLLKMNVETSDEKLTITNGDGTITNYKCPKILKKDSKNLIKKIKKYTK